MKRRACAVMVAFAVCACGPAQSGPAQSGPAQSGPAGSGHSASTTTVLPAEQIDELTPSERDAATKISDSITTVLRSRQRSVGPAGAASIALISRLFGDGSLTISVADYATDSAALIDERISQGADSAKVEEDRMQFSALARAFEADYTPPWFSEAASLTDSDAKEFWLRFGPLNVAVVPALYCDVRPFGTPEEELVTDLATTGGLFGATHAGITAKILTAQGCTPTIDEPTAFISSISDELAGYRDPLLKWLSLSDAERSTSPPPPPFDAMGSINAFDAAAEMELSAVTVGLSSEPDPRLVRFILAQFSPGKSLRSELDAGSRGDDFAWHALLLTSAFLHVAAPT